MAGFRDFQTGEVLTAANVNDFLAKQAVMKFADASARDTALGTATGGSNALREGMVAYLDDTDEVQVYDGTAWAGVGGGGFDSSSVITATDASWPVPASADGIFKVTVVGGGGGGGGSARQTSGSGSQGGTGGTTTFHTVTAAGGSGGAGAYQSISPTVPDGLRSGNHGQGAQYSRADDAGDGMSGYGGEVVVEYLDLSGTSTVAVTIGAGGSGGGDAGSGRNGLAGGDGAVIVEYRAA